MFKNRKTPENAAVHQIMITYYDGQYELFSNVVSLSFHNTKPSIFENTIKLHVVLRFCNSEGIC